MKRYELLSISEHADKKSVQVTCTNPEILQFITAKVKEVRPKSKVWFELKDAGGVVYRTALEQCGGEKERHEVTSLLFSYYCHQGWKPTERGLLLEVEVE